MRKKKNTYVEKIIFLLGLTISLYIGITILLLVIIDKSRTQDILGKVFLPFLLILLPIVLLIVIRKRVILPLRQYQVLSKRFLQGQIYREFMDELEDIFPGMKEVMDYIDSMINSQNLSQENKRRSEFLALQNQINPHFLYNTLEAIRGDALSVGMDNVADITEALSTFFRYSVTYTGSLVTIADELDNVDNYFKIQQYRFGEKLELIYETLEDESILELMCPKLTLQPIVENAIFHGLEKRSDKGSITIKLEMVDNKVLIAIIDNGVGMDSNTLDDLNSRLKLITMADKGQEEHKKKGGIALVNVCRRIRLLFGEDYGLHVFSIPDFGTDVRITLPMVKKNLEHDYDERINYN